MSQNQELDEMRSIYLDLLKILKAQGLSFILLAAAVWWFDSENRALKAKVDECSETIISIYQNQNSALLSTLKESQKILKNIELEIKESNEKE